MQDLHSLANAVRQKPSGLEGHPKGAMELLGADALLAGTQQVHGLQPNVQRDVARLHDGANGRSEWLAARVAFAGSEPGRLPLQTPDPIALTTTRADGAIRPNALFDKCQGGRFIMKNERRTERKRPSAFSCENTLPPNHWVSQV
jgi:hypothetical protein